MRMMISVALSKPEISHEYRSLVTTVMKEQFEQLQVIPNYASYFSDATQPYCFSVYLPKSRFEEVIKLDSPKFKIIFSSGNMTCFNDFSALFEKLKGEKIEVDDNRWTVRSIVNVEEQKVTSEQTHIRMLSPLVLMRARSNDDNPRWIGLSDNGFQEAFKMQIIKTITELGLPEKIADGLQLIPSAGDRKAKEVHVLHKGVYVRSIVGDMTLCASQELTQLLYQIGIGRKRKEGFGLFEIVNDN